MRVSSRPASRPEWRATGQPAALSVTCLTTRGRPKRVIGARILRLGKELHMPRSPSLSFAFLLAAVLAVGTGAGCAANGKDSTSESSGKSDLKMSGATLYERLG